MSRVLLGAEGHRTAMQQVNPPCPLCHREIGTGVRGGSGSHRGSGCEDPAPPPPLPRIPHVSILPAGRGGERKGGPAHSRVPEPALAGHKRARGRGWQEIYRCRVVMMPHPPSVQAHLAANLLPILILVIPGTSSRPQVSESITPPPSSSLLKAGLQTVFPETIIIPFLCSMNSYVSSPWPETKPQTAQAGFEGLA
ncbi:hypothetical protein HPG69_014029 [Diceros bicornis minor]|uniref:Uncharacterized protein n=1 Tax=Diceros bicornis minor TaxID=77932 RepID=A0A7J7EMS4_DICBM|nr:hypothetical protein HPG69_014029 [Diceros bicornis minor]